MRGLLCLIPTVFLGMQLTARAATIPAGADIEVRPDSQISVSQWDRGRIYRGYVARDVIARDGDVAIPQGSAVELIIRQRGPDRMAIDIESLNVGGLRYVPDTTGPLFRTPDYESGEGVVGAIVGAISGYQAEGDRISISPESILTFQTRAPFHVVDWADPGYERGGHHYHRDGDWYR